MEPARDERGDTPVFQPPSAPVSPQWSPLAMSGATSACAHHCWVERGAAMEPARDERGDRALAGEPCHFWRAAMEPARDERGDHQVEGAARSWRGAAMEPARDERGDIVGIIAGSSDGCGRNGARSR